MNFAKIHHEALQRGIEQKEPDIKQITAPEQKLLNKHQEWLRNPETIDLVQTCIRERQKLLDQAEVLASSSDPEDVKIRACLCKAKGINNIINLITKYGKLDNDRDSAS